MRRSRTRADGRPPSATLPRLADEAFSGPVVLLLGEALRAAAADPDRVRTEFLQAAEAHLLRAAV